MAQVLKRIRIWDSTHSHDYRQCLISMWDQKANRLVFKSGGVSYEIVYGISALVEVSNE